MAQQTQAIPARKAAAKQDEASLLQRIRWNVSDTVVMTRRNLTYYLREPQLLVFATVQPVMFLLLFTFVFGGAIGLGGPAEGGAPPAGAPAETAAAPTEATAPDDAQSGSQAYLQYLLPGILVQTIIFAATQTTTGLVNDLSKGMIDRFRSLPMGRAAVLAGRTLADATRGLFTTTIMLLVGFLIGYRFGGSFLAGVGGLLLAVAFGYAMTWVSALIALFVKDPEAAQVAGFIWVFPLVFASSIFVPPQTMPDWLRVFAENQPITVIANAVRGAMSGNAAAGDIGLAFMWIAIIIGIFMPLAVWQYGRATAE